MSKHNQGPTAIRRTRSVLNPAVKPQILSERKLVPKEEPLPVDRARNISRVVSTLENEIRGKLPMFPSVIYQQSRGANFAPNWNWNRSFVKCQEEAAKASDGISKYNVVLDFYFQVTSVASLLDQIRHDFQHGLRQYNPQDPDSIVVKICKEMTVCKVGTRGRNTISDGTVPYLKEIFQSEIEKQEKYKKWMTGCLSDPIEVRRRNNIVNWVIKTAKQVGYPAETVHLAVYYIDAYLTIKGNKIANCTWELLAITALHIAGKLEEVDPVHASKLTRLSRSLYKVEEINWMEKDILKKLKFDVYPPLAPLFAHMVLLAGSLDFTTIHLRKLTLDMTLGILHRSLLNHKLFTVPPADKAKAALEISVEFIYHQYRLCISRDMSYYTTLTNQPGLALGELALDMCTETFNNRFLNRKLLNLIPAATCKSSPVRDIKT